MNKNPVLVARYFHHNDEIFLKEMVLYEALGKTKCHALLIEFQERGAHMFTNLSGFSVEQIFKMKMSILIIWKDATCSVSRAWEWAWPFLISQNLSDSFSFQNLLEK